ncbi:hypothetical protein V6R21_32330 [Limibacter armeniacum]|uniref:hypothetical protein n=1 Tax=Limibacter armeniacum TaxID=466084 RepID=UPI002FE5A134
MAKSTRLTQFIHNAYIRVKSKDFKEEEHCQYHNILRASSDLGKAAEAANLNKKAYIKHYINSLTLVNFVNPETFNFHIQTFYPIFIKDTFEDKLASSFLWICDWISNNEGKLMISTIGYVYEKNLAGKQPTFKSIEHALVYAEKKVLALDPEGPGTTREYQAGAALAAIMQVANYKGVDLFLHAGWRLAFNRTRPVDRPKKTMQCWYCEDKLYVDGKTCPKCMDN